MRNIFGKNLKYLRERKGLEQAELAQLLGRKSGSSVSEWEKGTYEPKSGLLADISKIFNVSLHDLMDKDLTIPSNLVHISPNTIRIPILGIIACGDPILAEDNIKGYRYESPDDLPSGTLYYLEAKGNSMEPTIPDGSHVLIREQPEVEYGEIAAVLVNGNTEATLKRVRKQGKMIMLMPDNPAHEPFIITEDNPARIIGKAVEVKYKL
ncbi:LexA family transcriptional regulator [Sporosarcina sp. Te-1]|uniref:LexA family protein n=1 Tax=Sporosarcina sp. Te-1 TaxID=2818390 RepID=UPI001A9E6694|nr:XRE family transcriptional regulator [Sporosarcina sp. Te-1]QTD41534.1 helix-turn-helix domain-containing protein [Sporosarcina sp. Te-1]